MGKLFLSVIAHNTKSFVATSCILRISFPCLSSTDAKTTKLHGHGVHVTPGLLAVLQTSKVTTVTREWIVDLVIVASGRYGEDG